MSFTSAKVRSFALARPEADETSTWGHPTFRVAGKIFVSLPDDATAVVKTSPSEQRALMADDAATFSVAPRVGRHGWVAVRLAGVGADRMRELISTAYESVAPARLRSN